MALKFNKVEPIRFGDFEVSPNLTQELKLRLRELDLKTDQGVEEAKSVLAKCFGDQEFRVKEFIDANMYQLDLIELQVYLLQGPQGVLKYERRLDEAFAEEYKTARQEMKSLGGANV